MKDSLDFDAIIIGGSYSGLSAAMALGRSLRKVLILDSGFPCNRQTPHSHNFITQDGEKPHLIAEKAKAQVLNYQTVKFITELAVDGEKTNDGFSIVTDSGEIFKARNLVFSTGLKDKMPAISGFSDCWGISVIHCPYCHGYEVKGEKTGILANGEFALHYAQLIRNWTEDLTIFTNGKSTLTPGQADKLEKHRILIVEKEIDFLDHEAGYLNHLVFKDNSTFELKALYSRPDFEQHCKIPEKLGCELTEQGFLRVDMLQKTTVANIFACGDNSSPMRSVASAVAAGNMAGAMLNSMMTEEEFR